MLMSTVYAISSRWDRVTRVRSLMRDKKKVKKVLGYTWIEVNDIFVKVSGKGCH